MKSQGICNSTIPPHAHLPYGGPLRRGASTLKGVPPFPKRPAYKDPPIPICLISTPKPYGRRCAIPPRPESRSRATLCSAAGPLYAANRPAVIRRGVFHDTSACLFGHRSLGFPALAFSDHDVYGHVHGLRHLSGIPQAAPENVSLVGHDNIHRGPRGHHDLADRHRGVVGDAASRRRAQNSRRPARLRLDTQPGSPGVVRFRGRMAQKPPRA